MKNRMLIDVAGILAIYILYLIATVMLYGVERFSGDAIETLPLVMVGVSLACTLCWYALGEWVIRPFASAGTWYAVWALLLMIVVATASYVSFREGVLANLPGHTDAETFTWLHFVGGIGSYYLSSVFFSPTFAKFRIWPASHVRS